MKKAAFLLLNVGDISGGGGTQRFFAEVHAHYAQKANAQFECTLVTDERSYENLRSMGKLANDAGIVRLNVDPVGTSRAANIASTTFELLRWALLHRPDIIHVCLPLQRYLPFLMMVSRLPARIRPKIALSIVDARVAPYLLKSEEGDYEDGLDSYDRYFTHVHIDAIFTWYKAFREAAEATSAIKSRPLIVPTRYCFTDTTKFVPAAEKENSLVFAHRLTPQKQPEFFLSGLKLAQDLAPEELAGWRVKLYGKGPLRETVERKIRELKLDALVELGEASDLAPILARSRIFVSTQDFENFTSLSVLEAMSCGNAVIARAVGQTEEFVKHERNGLLLDEDSPAGLARAIIRCVSEPGLCHRLQIAGAEIARTVHTVDNFLADIEHFWVKTLAGQETRRRALAAGGPSDGPARR